MLADLMDSAGDVSLWWTLIGLAVLAAGVASVWLVARLFASPPTRGTWWAETQADRAVDAHLEERRAQRDDPS